jgi:hypothetical protein
MVTAAAVGVDVPDDRTDFTDGVFALKTSTITRKRLFVLGSGEVLEI